MTRDFSAWAPASFHPPPVGTADCSITLLTVSRPLVGFLLPCLPMAGLVAKRCSQSDNYY
jgi:hypothetical protein